MIDSIQHTLSHYHNPSKIFCSIEKAPISCIFSSYKNPYFPAMDRLKSILSLVLIVGSLPLLSQNLERKGSLGVHITPITDSIAAIFELPEKRGVLAQLIIPQSTAENLHMQVNDIILEVEGQTIETTAQLVAETSTWREGDVIDMLVFRKGETVRLGGMVKGKPMETSPLAEVYYDEVPFQEGYLRSIMHIPKDGLKFPVVFYIQGFDCGSIDSYHTPNTMMRKWVDGLVQQGFAVFPG